MTGQIDHLYLEMFGGGPDKTGAQNSAALTKLVTSIQNGARRIRFGNGKYSFDAPWPTTFGTGIHGVHIEGVGAHRQLTDDSPTILELEASADDIFWQPTNMHHCSFRHVKMITDDPSVRRTEALSLRGCSGWSVEQVHVRQFSAVGIEVRSDTAASGIYNNLIGCSASNLTKADAADDDAVGLRFRDPDSGKAANQNNVLNFNAGTCDIGVNNQDTPNENGIIGLEVGSCGIGIRTVGRNFVVQNANIENCTTGIAVPSGATGSMIMIGRAFNSNTADRDIQSNTYSIFELGDGEFIVNGQTLFRVDSTIFGPISGSTTVAATSASTIAARTVLGTNTLYLAVVNADGLSNATTAMVICPGASGTIVVANAAQNGSNIDFNVNGSNELEIRNNSGSQETLNYNLIRIR